MKRLTQEKGKASSAHSHRESSAQPRLSHHSAPRRGRCPQVITKGRQAVFSAGDQYSLDSQEMQAAVSPPPRRRAAEFVGCLSSCTVQTTAPKRARPTAASEQESAGVLVGSGSSPRTSFPRTSFPRSNPWPNPRPHRLPGPGRSLSQPTRGLSPQREARDKLGGATPLHVAARNGRVKLVELLLQVPAVLGGGSSLSNRPCIWVFVRRRSLTCHCGLCPPSLLLPVSPQAGADVDAQLLTAVGQYEPGETPVRTPPPPPACSSAFLAKAPPRPCARVPLPSRRRHINCPPPRGLAGGLRIPARPRGSRRAPAQLGALCPNALPTAHRLPPPPAPPASPHT